MSEEKIDYINALPKPVMPIKRYWDHEEGYYYCDAMNRSISHEQILEALNGHFAAGGK